MAVGTQRGTDSGDDSESGTPAVDAGIASQPGLALYEFWSCPYCARVRTAIERLGLEIESRDIQNDSEHLRDLVKATGSRQVPVLRIEDGEGVHWLRESVDIVRYLERRFAA